MDYRNFAIETGLLVQTNGSASLRIGDSRIVVGIKAEIGAPNPAFPNRGQIVCSVDWGRSPDNSTNSEKNELLANSLSRALERVLTPSPANQGGLDLNSLCIIPGRQCWILYIDALIFGRAGNLLDSISICTRAALRSTRIPKINLVPGELHGELEIELSDDPLECTRIDVQNIPICVSLTKIGKRYIIDPSPEEEQCMNMQFTVGVDRAGNFCGMTKSGRGGIDPSGVLEMLQSVKIIGSALLERIDKVLQEEETAQRAVVGFLG